MGGMSMFRVTPSFCIIIIIIILYYYMYIVFQLDID